MRHVRIHKFEAEKLMAHFGCSSTLNTAWDFTRLRDIGRERADDWHAKSFAKLGLQATVDVEQRFLSALGGPLAPLRITVRRALVGLAEPPAGS